MEQARMTGYDVIGRVTRWLLMPILTLLAAGATFGIDDEDAPKPNE
jgi:hypothetical protein